ncbi:MAG TPA: hypothetical protein VNT54_08295 [Solirubrobacteraceae bacterium]|nr:hypothetical protein [Solirubrobacteraceae bacterium]
MPSTASIGRPARISARCWPSASAARYSSSATVSPRSARRRVDDPQLAELVAGDDAYVEVLQQDADEPPLGVELVAGAAAVRFALGPRDLAHR